MKYILTIILILLSSTVISAYGHDIHLSPEEEKWLNEDHTVRVRVANWPPFQFKDINNPKGISIDYIQHILDTHNIKYEFISADKIPWKEALEYLQNQHTIDLLLTAKRTDERAKHMLFTDTYINSPWVIFTRENYPFISDIDDLKGKTVVVQNSFLMYDLLKNNYPEIKLKIVTGSNATEQALQTLAVGEADAYIGNLATGSYIAKSLNLLNIRVAAPTPFGKHDNSMAIRKDWPELTSIINKTLNSMPQTLKNEILNKYSVVRYDHGVEYTDVLLWVSISLLICGIIIFIFLQINRHLNCEITQRKNIEKDMQEYISLVDDNIISLTFDHDNIITSVSTAFCKVSKYTKEEAIGLNLHDIWSPDIKTSTYENLMYTIKNHLCWSGEIENIDKDGTPYWIKSYISPKLDNDKNLINYTSIGQNITDKKRIEILSITDTLTGLYNRLKLDENFSYELQISQRYKKNFSIIMIDIDNFKEVNDTYGHSIGDTVLKEIANLIKKNTRNTDTVGRWGGEEFLILCPKSNFTAAITLAEKLRNIIDTAKLTKVQHKTISLGVSTYKNHDTIIDMVNRADIELYKSKTAGKNKVFPQLSEL